MIKNPFVSNHSSQEIYHTAFAYPHSAIGFI